MIFCPAFGRADAGFGDGWRKPLHWQGWVWAGCARERRSVRRVTWMVGRLMQAFMMGVQAEYEWKGLVDNDAGLGRWWG